MSHTSRVFAADVELQCRIFWGPKSGRECAATAVSINSGSMVVRFAHEETDFPAVGERVGLEVLLPSNSSHAAPRCLSFRARVIEVADAGDGLRSLILHFRKATFRDAVNGERRKGPGKLEFRPERSLTGRLQ